MPLMVSIWSKYVIFGKNGPNWVILGAKMPHFGQFLAKMAKTVKIIKKALGTFFSPLQALTNCKVSEKSNEYVRRDFQLFQHLAKLAKVRQNLGQFWPKWAIFEISTKSENIIILRLQRLCFEQKIRKF